MTDTEILDYLARHHRCKNAFDTVICGVALTFKPGVPFRQAVAEGLERHAAATVAAKLDQDDAIDGKGMFGAW